MSFWFQLIPFASGFSQRGIHASAICLKTQSGKYKITPKRDKPLTYEMANPPYLIVVRKSWNSWNCCKFEMRQKFKTFSINLIGSAVQFILFLNLQPIYRTACGLHKRPSRICTYGSSLLVHFMGWSLVKSL